MAEADEAAAKQQAYDAQKTGDPIGDAALREDLGVPTTPQEQEQLDDQRFDLAFSPNVLARARFEASNPEGAPSEQTAAELAKFQSDREAAVVQRDPVAFAASQQALGIPTTPTDIANFENPTLTEVLQAERETQLTGMPVPDDSPLAVKADQIWADTDKANIDRDPDAFIRSRGHLPTTPEDLANFNNPSVVDVLQAARQTNLLRGDIPADSALASQLDNVMSGHAPGAVTPTNTMGLGSAVPSAGTGTAGTGTAGTGTAGTGTGTGPIDRGAVDPTGTGTGGVEPSPTSQPAGPDVPTTPEAPVAAGATTSDATLSPIDAALANLTGGAPAEADVPTSRGTDGTTSTADLGWPGGVGSSSQGGETGRGPTIVIDDSGADMTTVGGQSTGADGGVTTDLPGGGTGTMYPDGTTVYRDSSGQMTGTMTGGNYEATSKGSDESASNTTDSGDPPAEDPPPDDPPPDDSTDDSTDTAMVNPDDARLTGLAASVATGLETGRVPGSSTQSGVTDSGRGDLDTGLGAITGETVGHLTAGPDANPDDPTLAGGRQADMFTSTRGGATDGVNPNLLDEAGIGGAPERPTDTGTNPYGSLAGGTMSDAGGGSGGLPTVTSFGGAGGGSIGIVVAPGSDESAVAAGDGRGSASYAETAAGADTSTESPTDGSGVSAVTSAGRGIQTVDTGTEGQVSNEGSRAGDEAGLADPIHVAGEAVGSPYIDTGADLYERGTPQGDGPEPEAPVRSVPVGTTGTTLDPFESLIAPATSIPGDLGAVLAPLQSGSLPPGQAPAGSTGTTTATDATDTSDHSGSDQAHDDNSGTSTDAAELRGDALHPDDMVNPDDAAATGFAVGLVDSLATAATLGSSTQSGVTDGGRGDLDAGLGAITGERAEHLTAGPDVDPDSQSAGADPAITDIGRSFQSGVTDGVRPDLLDAAGIGAPELPPDTGTNPHGAALGDVTGMESDSVPDDAGRGSQSYAESGGDDDDLEELQVQRDQDPDSAPVPAGLAVGMGDPLGMDSLAGSPAAMTDAGRGDLDAGLGSVTGETDRPMTAGGDANRDDRTDFTGATVEPVQPPTDIAPLDGGPPDLIDANTPVPDLPPTDDGANPFGIDPGGHLDAASVDPTALQPTDGDGPLGGDGPADGQFDPSTAELPDDGADQFGGPMDDGFDR